MKVLLVEDDADVLDVTTYALRREGYTVVQAIDGQQALQRWEAEQPDLVLLDVNVPKLNGFEVCRRIRDEGRTPVVMLTARHEEEDVIRGLKLGADDYVTKPFSPKQLVARTEAVLRRSREDTYCTPARELTVGDLHLDIESHEARKAGRPVHLTPLEFRILSLLAMNAGRVIPHARLIEQAWGHEGGDRAMLKSHISHLRTKLGLPAEGPRSVKVVPGVGYSLGRT